MNKCVFLDRDGTINKEVGYLYKTEDFEILPTVVDGLRLLQKTGFLLIIVSNQSGIARGYFTEDDLRILNQSMLSTLKEKDILIDDIFYCPHLENAKIPIYAKECECRKPKIGMLSKAQKKYNIDFNCSYMIGDKKTDMQVGKRAGCSTILVQTGYGLIEESGVNKETDYIAKNFIDAAKWIIDSECKMELGGIS